MFEYLKKLEEFPISFKYGSIQYMGFGENFTEICREQVEKDNNRTNTVVYMRHSPSGVDFKLEINEYSKYNAMDYTLYITNNTDKTTDVIGDINAIDIIFTGDNPIMKGIQGDCGKDMYKPYAQDMSCENVFFRESVSGRPSHGVFPYFNLEHGTGGTFIAIGWPGCWKAKAEYGNGNVHFTGGQREICTVLEPGQTIRTPLIAMLDYEGRDEKKYMNLWRRWYIDCNAPKVDGKPMEPVMLDYTLSQGQTTESIISRIKAYAEHDLPLDYFWIDAGWYTDSEGNTVEWPKTGTLLIDESRFPDKFASISAELAKTGGKLLLWFEPEVVRLDKETFLANTPDFDPDWMLGVAFKDTWLEGQVLNLGNKDCRNWMTEKILKIMREGKISLYRQDFNVDPAPVWQENDKDNQIGYTENQYVIGYLAFWDTLLKELPDLRIDSCASGGGRNDLETMRRAIPLHISDYWDGNPAGYDERHATMISVMQWFTYIQMFMYGNDSVGDFIYRARSSYAQVCPLSMDNVQICNDWELIRKLKKEWDEISVYYYNDFYPLTPWSNNDDVWTGFEFFDGEKDAGFAQLFRAEKNIEDTKKIKFYGLNSEAKYRIYDTDDTLDIVYSGKILMEEGIDITLPTPLYAMIIHIEKI